MAVAPTGMYAEPIRFQLSHAYCQTHRKEAYLGRGRVCVCTLRRGIFRLFFGCLETPLGLKFHVYHNRKSIVSLLKMHKWKPPGSLAFFVCVQEQLLVAS